MAAPIALQTYPADNDTGIPIGISIEVVFDRGIDLSTAKDHVVLYGADFDQTSGPESATWIDSDTGNNPYFLRSPGFQGLVELSARVVYVDLSTGPNYTEVDPGTITSEADEAAFGASGVGHKLILTPREQLAPELLYNFYLLGDPDSVGAGVGSRSVFDVVPDVGNLGNGSMTSYGGYTGTSADTVIVEITSAGDIGTAKYRWYYQSAGAGTAISGRITARRYRRLEDGLQVRFDGDSFVVGDLFTFNVEPIERLAANNNVQFTTNDGSFVDPPSSPSTPATSSPPASVLPPAPGGGASVASTFFVDEVSPEDRAWNVSTNLRTITITFSENLDPTTVTDDTVSLCKYPVKGIDGSNPQPEELQKKLTVAGNILTIEF
jgi:hypothetical protein